MNAKDRPDTPAPHAAGPASFPAAAAALEAIDRAVRTAQHGEVGPPGPGEGPEQALASLLLLREIRERLAGWESGLIENARDAGASWADLALPLGVASRQAAERRYLRLRPGLAGTTGEQRVTATRERRAAERAAGARARDNAADLRRLAGQITALTDLPAGSRASVGRLDRALGEDDPAALIAPLDATRPHLTVDHPELVARIDALVDPPATGRAGAT
ncbi:type III effector protein [Embleya sp. AB8]|uniref:type III effector protein n=1 Tax=Embleya sp. AB8 TaxID=3156304 RepID=UPI003C71B44D